MLRKVDKRSVNFEPCHRGAFGEIRTHTALLLRQSPLPELGYEDKNVSERTGPYINGVTRQVLDYIKLKARLLLLSVIVMHCSQSLNVLNDLLFC